MYRNALLLGAFVNLRKATISCVMPIRQSFCQHGKTGLPLDGFS